MCCGPWQETKDNNGNETRYESNGLGGIEVAVIEVVVAAIEVVVAVIEVVVGAIEVVLDAFDVVVAVI